MLPILNNNLIPPELDLVFIDGAHGFPAPIIDWHYTARKFKLGGILSVDDFKMPSVKILYDFLCDEEEWKRIRVVHNTAFSRKLQEPKDIVHWNGQKLTRSFRDINHVKRVWIFCPLKTSGLFNS